VALVVARRPRLPLPRGDETPQVDEVQREALAVVVDFLDRHNT
jgi:hypothetical protein